MKRFLVIISLVMLFFLAWGISDYGQGKPIQAGLGLIYSDSVKTGDTVRIFNLDMKYMQVKYSQRDIGTNITDSTLFYGGYKRYNSSGVVIDTFWQNNPLLLKQDDISGSFVNCISAPGSTASFTFVNNSMQLLKVVLCNKEYVAGRIIKFNIIANPFVPANNWDGLGVNQAQRKWLIDNGFNEIIAPIVTHKILTNNYAILDANGNYHWMVKIPAFNWSPDSGFTSHQIHPAFVVNGVQKEIYIGKYEAGLNGGKLVTQPNQEVFREIKYDDANTACNSLNGITISGFHMLTNSEWAAVAIVSKNIMGSVEVRGNNNYGRDQSSDNILGVPEFCKPYVFINQDDPARWLTGSGGVATSHDGTIAGIFDLNGNVNEWVKGLRLSNGEINIFTNNDGAASTIDIGVSSGYWKAILENGTLVAPGTENTLKYNDKGQVSKGITGEGDPTDGYKFQGIICAPDIDSTSAGVSLLKKLLLYPSVRPLFDDYFYHGASSENVPVRGGGWNNGASAGLFSVNLSYERGAYDGGVGFRVAFVK